MRHRAIYRGIGNSAAALDFHFRGVRSEPPAPQSPAPVPIDASTLPLMQQAALLQMHESHVRRAIVAKLLEDSQDRFTMIDFNALVGLGLSVKPPAEKWHKLTESGAVSAKALERQLCIAFTIHMLTESPSQAGWECKFSCPCGFETMVRRSYTSLPNAQVQHSTYIRTQQRMLGLARALQPVGA